METISKTAQIRIVARDMGIEYTLASKIIDSYYSYVRHMITVDEEPETGFLGFLVFSKVNKDLSTCERNTYAYQVHVVATEIGESEVTVKGVLDFLRDTILNDIKSGMLGYNLFSLATIWTDGGRLKSRHSSSLTKSVRIRATNWIRSEVARDMGKTLV